MTPNRWIKRSSKSKASAQRGMSLIELMISLVLGLLVTAAVYQIYSANLRSSRMQNALSEVQENGRFALEILSRDARQSGYRGGCAIDSPITNHLKISGAEETGLFDLQAGIEGWDGDGGIYESELKGHVAGTDVVLIKHFATPTRAVLNGTPGINSESITVVDASGVPKGAILVIADALACDVFQNTQESDISPFDRSANDGSSPDNFTPGNLTPGSSPLNKSYEANGHNGSAQIMRFESSLYYLGESKADDKTIALRRRSYSRGLKVQGRSSVEDEELISGIVDMQMFYRVDDQGNEYVPANRVADWHDVLGVSFHLLLRAEAKNILLSPAVLSYAGHEFNAGPDDLRLYQVFTTTVGIRNRLR